MNQMKHLKGRVNPKYIICDEGILYAPLNIVAGIFDLDMISIKIYVERLINSNAEIFGQFFKQLKDDEYYVNWMGAIILSLLKKECNPYIKRRKNLVSCLLSQNAGFMCHLESKTQGLLRRLGELSGFKNDACIILENAFFIGYYGLKREEVLDLASQFFKKEITEVFPNYLPMKDVARLYNFYMEAIHYLKGKHEEQNTQITESEFFSACYDLASLMKKIHCEWFPNNTPEIKYV